MDRATEIYKGFIDCLAEKSKSYADANLVKKGDLPATSAEHNVLCNVLKKLDDNERNALAELLLEAYHSGIYDTLEELEWLRCCRNMTITVEGETLPLGKFEGVSNDYIGRRLGWDWPECV